MTAKSRVRVECHGEVTEISLDAPPMDNTIYEWSNALVATVEEIKPKRLVVSFEFVNRLPSAAIGTLLRMHKRIQPYCGQLRLCGMRADVREVFKIMGLDGPVFKIFDSCRSARESFQ